MPSPTYFALAKTVLTGTQATITFSNIPSTYTDLIVFTSARTNANIIRDNIKMTINGASTNYSEQIIYSVESSTSISAFYQSANWLNLLYANGNSSSGTSNTFNSLEIYFSNYTSSTAKPISSTSVSERNLNQGWWLSPGAHLWNNTQAITSLTFVPTTGTNFLADTSFYLYGIKNS